MIEPDELSLHESSPASHEPWVDDPLPLLDEPLVDEPLVDEPLVDDPLPLLDEPLLDDPLPLLPSLAWALVIVIRAGVA